MAKEEKYKEEWLAGQHQTDYNMFRFTSDRTKTGIDWLESRGQHVHPGTQNNLSELIVHEKLYGWGNLTKTMWSDRVAVYDLVDRIELSQYMIPALVKAYADEKPFTEQVLRDLAGKADKVIVKCNHASGWNIIVDLTKPETFAYTVEKMNEWLSLNYAYICGEYHYEKIRPGYVIQPIVGVKPIDYMFYYKDGKFIAADVHQKLSHVMIKHFFLGDVDGTPAKWYIGFRPIFSQAPKMLVDAMQACKPVADKIARSIGGLVRVDFFYIDDKVMFVEPTFTSNAGINDFTVR